MIFNEKPFLPTELLHPKAEKRQTHKQKCSTGFHAYDMQQSTTYSGPGVLRIVYNDIDR